MAYKVTAKQIQELLASLAAGQGVEIWGVEIGAFGKKTLIRIYLDSEDGVTIDMCARFSRNAEVILEVEDIIPGAYVLEVSSPGLDRPFFRPDQLKGYEGRKLKVELQAPRDGRRKWTAPLKEATETAVVLDSDGQDVELEWADIKKVRLHSDI